MKKISILILSGIAFLAGSAEQISESQAQAIASKYLDAGASRHRLMRAQVKNQADESAYYVFNSTGGAGFVIVSGDDEMTELVGYSATGRFDPSDIPSNMRHYLDQYAEYVEKVQSGEAVPNKRAVKAGTPVVGPLVKTKWDQTAPYNNLCPADRRIEGAPLSYTGCVATAMAQVMYHHKWPVAGKGKNAYTTETLGKYISLDFSQSTYDWENMQLTYDGDETPAQNSAVARLMYDCGVAVNMDYNAYEGSGAIDVDIPAGVADHFGYKSQCYLRDAYSADDFLKIIKNEVDNNRPVLFAGQGAGGGHEFVVDGYDSNDFLSVNWGWGGKSDGFFDMGLMNPGDLGAGGGTGGFSEFQSVVTMEKDPTMTGDAGQVPMFLLPSEYSWDGQSGYVRAERADYAKGEAVNFDVTRVWNTGKADFNGYLAVGVYDREYNLVAVSAEKAIRIGKYEYSTAVDRFTMQDELAGLADGQYTFWAVTKQRVTGKTFDWLRVATAQVESMTVEGESISVGVADGTLSIDGVISASKSTVYPGDKVTFSFAVKNESIVPVSGRLLLDFVDVAEERSVMTKNVMVSLSEMSSTPVSVEATLPKAVFKAGRAYRAEVSKVLDGSGKTLSVDMPQGGYVLEIDDPSGVGGLSAECVVVSGGKGEITVVGAERVEIYTMGGVLVSRANRADVEAGLYIVKADGVVRKVIVK